MRFRTRVELGARRQRAALRPVHFSRWLVAPQPTKATSDIWRTPVVLSRRKREFEPPRVPEGDRGPFLSPGSVARQTTDREHPQPPNTLLSDLFSKSLFPVELATPKGHCGDLTRRSRVSVPWSFFRHRRGAV